MSALLFLWLMIVSVAAPGGVSGSIRGSVVDSHNAPIAEARLAVRNAGGAVLQQAVTNASGRFELAALPTGLYALCVEARGFQARTVSLAVANRQVTPLTIVLGVEPVVSQVTVTAARAAVEDAGEAARLVTVRGREEFLRRPPATVGAAFENSPGVMVQQTTAGQVSPHLRGLTGYQTLLLVDGVRFNTSIFRSGPNQYLGFIDPSQVDGIEAALGPAGAAYGSDALGGAINVLTPMARFNDSARRTAHGEFNLFGGSADLSAGASAQIVAGNDRVAWIVGGAGRKHQDLRAGRGVDSHNVFHRYFGLPAAQVRQLLGDRLQDTAYSQLAAHTKLAMKPAADQNLTLWYQRGDLTGVRSYRDLLGGLGRLQARAEPQTLNFFYARYEKLGWGQFDSVSGTFSVNSQRDDTVRQGTRSTDPITRDENRVYAFGYAAQATAHVGSRHTQVFGGEVYREHVFSRRFEDDPRTGQTAERRALNPNGSRYTTTALFAQNSSELVRDRLRAVVGVRFTNVAFGAFAARNRDAEGRYLGVSDSAQSFRDFTYHGSLSWRMTRQLGWHFLIGRGFRAPNLNDLGAIGLTGLGFEIPAAQAIPAGALLGADAGEGALPAGRPLETLGPESLMNYEFGLTVRTDRFYGRAQAFNAEFRDPIVRRTLLFPADRIPAALAGIPVTPIAQTAAQRQQGVVTVATAFDPRAVKAFVNDGQSRYYGFEAIVRFQASPRWSFDGNYSFLAGRDLNPNRPARRLPPQQAFAAVRYAPSGRWWGELSGAFAGAQRRLSAGDLDDERIGASRRRSDIAGFFRSAIVNQYLSAGADGRMGTADDLFTPTGETLSQIQNRVLPLGAVINGVAVLNDNTRVPLFRQTDSWVTLNVRGGVALKESLNLTFGVMNVLDRNYRIHGSGIDASGANAFIGIKLMF